MNMARSHIALVFKVKNITQEEAVRELEKVKEFLCESEFWNANEFAGLNVDDIYVDDKYEDWHDDTE